MVSLLPTKIQENLCSGLRGDALTNSSLIHSINGKKSKCKNSKIPGKLMEPEFPGTCNIHIYTLCPKG